MKTIRQRACAASYSLSLRDPRTRVGVTVSFFPLRTFVLAVVALSLVSISARVCAQIPCNYEVSAIIQAPDCGIFGPPSIESRGLSDIGSVVGTVRDCQGEDEEAWRWTAEAGFSLLNMPDGASNSVAMDINDLGFMTGYAEVSNDKGLGRLAFLHDGEEVITLMMPFEGGTYTEGLAINNNLQIVGNWGNQLVGNPPFEAFIWQDGVLRSLADDLGTPNSQANDINSHGMVTGWMGGSPSFDGNPYIWHKGRVTELPVIPGGFTSWAEAIHNHGDVVGTGGVIDPDTGEAVRRAFVWRDGVMTVIEPAPGFTDSVGVAIKNDAGLVIGSFSDPGGVAFIWFDGQVVPIDPLLPPQDPPLNISTLWDINNAGQLISSGTNRRVFVFTPVSGRGDLDSDDDVDPIDLLLLLADWGRCAQCTCSGCPADLNLDCVVGAADLIILLGNWG